MKLAEQGKIRVVAADMGYGHLRAAMAISQELGLSCERADLAPLADEKEIKIWTRSKKLYEFASRASQLPYLGRPFRGLLNSLTYIPDLYPHRDLSALNWSVRFLDRQIDSGLGKNLAEQLKTHNATLCSSFYIPAIAADAAGCERVFCVVTDSDIHRIWVPVQSNKTKIHYLVPSRRAYLRLISYGVPKEQIHFTGFPLPGELLGGQELVSLRENLRSRLVRLDPERVFFKQYRDELRHFLGVVPQQNTVEPPLLTFAVGGAGAQIEIAKRFLPDLGAFVRSGKIRLALVAGIRREIAEGFETLAIQAGMKDLLGNQVQIFWEPDFESYFHSFNKLLAKTDMLWTKPSELTFYAALGIPMIFSWPVGHHERCNRRWAIEAGAGLKQGAPEYASHWINDWLSEGTLAAAAWSGFMRLPKFGLYRIVDALDETKLLINS